MEMGERQNRGYRWNLWVVSRIKTIWLCSSLTITTFFRLTKQPRFPKMTKNHVHQFYHSCIYNKEDTKKAFQKYVEVREAKFRRKKLSRFIKYFVFSQRPPFILIILLNFYILFIFHHQFIVIIITSYEQQHQNVSVSEIRFFLKFNTFMMHRMIFIFHYYYHDLKQSFCSWENILHFHSQEHGLIAKTYEGRLSNPHISSSNLQYFSHHFRQRC